MLYELLLTLFIVNSVLLILLVLIQQGKSSMGMGNLGGSAQMLFGGSGGQDVFQKTTWVLGALFMVLSFVLTVMRANTEESSRFLKTKTVATSPLLATPAPRQATTEQAQTETATTQDAPATN
jgi:preprotein translocase subunit SecG